MNWTRYHRASPLPFDHEFLTVAWRMRIQKWGLFGYHYLGKNLGVALTSLPWLAPHDGSSLGAPFKINEHGLALWFTSPFYFWLLLAEALRRSGRPQVALRRRRAVGRHPGGHGAALPEQRVAAVRLPLLQRLLGAALRAPGPRRTPARVALRRRSGVGHRVERLRRRDLRQGAVRSLLLPRRLADDRLPAGLANQPITSAAAPQPRSVQR